MYGTYADITSLGTIDEEDGEHKVRNILTIQIHHVINADVAAGGKGYS